MPVRQALLVGGFGTSLAGQTEDSLKKRLLSNLFNVTPRGMRRSESINTWTGSATNAWRQAGGNALNQLEWFSINGAYPVTAQVSAMVVNDTSAIQTAGTAIGLDTTTSPVLGSFRDNSPVDNIRYYMQKASFCDFVTRGRHTLVWLEVSGTNGVRTWYGDFGDDVNYQTGISGMVYN